VDNESTLKRLDRGRGWVACLRLLARNAQASAMHRQGSTDNSGEQKESDAHFQTPFERNKGSVPFIIPTVQLFRRFEFHLLREN
jgi:hypothetical protein